MYFLIIMAFAFVLSEGLPPPGCNILRGAPDSADSLTLLLALGQIAAAACLAIIVRHVVSKKIPAAGDSELTVEARTEQLEDAADELTRGQQYILALLSAFLVVTMICTPWTVLVRKDWGLGRVPLIADFVILIPLFASLFCVWGLLYRVEQSIRLGGGPVDSAMWSSAGLRHYLMDKFRHQVLVIATPMAIIVFAKFFTDKYETALRRFTYLPWIADALLGTVSIAVLIISPVLLRYAWATERLPDGPLRERFVRTCRRIGLRYREILLWKTHNTAINAAVMGFVPPLRYILVSDALLATMKEEEIEAVFGHEAGHVRHWHLQYFGLFAILSMYLAGGVLEILYKSGLVLDITMLNLAALVVLLACWLFGFGWLSRRFERQADLFGVRCLGPDIAACVQWCPVHVKNAETQISDLKSQSDGERVSTGSSSVATAVSACSGVLCVTAANLFGRTLNKIADLNGIPREAKSWRHGSIASRCRLIEQFAADRQALEKFDRDLRLIKTGLIIVTAIGTIVAAWLYYDSVAQAVRMWMRG